ncbi:MAG: vitamin B12 dependent-methionine synthase activation domain-containing protein [Thermodesulfobacteriota bacterium]|nr:vitamin B12 dependent-methionine synthase activation domain-containing protein [Thermodesulfobacteriota bacterium]
MPQTKRGKDGPGRKPGTIIRFEPGEIIITPDEAARYLGGSRYRPDKDLEKSVQDAISQAGRLACPAFIHALHKVEETSPAGGLTLENGLFLDRPHAETGLEIRSLAACVFTLGGALEDTIHELSSRGDLLEAFILEAVGLALMEALGDKCRQALGQKAKQLKLFAGCAFGPGFRETPMEKQALLFQLVDAEAIGVRLTENLMMRPLKSASFFAAFSPAESKIKHVYKCRRCSMKNCLFRVEK